MIQKYHYKQSWAAMQKELPDIKLEDYVKESSKLVILTWIANELATANKLKAIELNPSKTPTDTSFWEQF